MSDDEDFPPSPPFDDDDGANDRSHDEGDQLGSDGEGDDIDRELDDENMGTQVSDESDEESDEDLELKKDGDRNLNKKSKRKLKESKPARRAKKKRSSVARFFADQAEVADDSESEGDEFITEKGAEEIQSKDIMDAIQRVETRHKIDRERLKRSTADIAREYEERARDDLKYTQSYSRIDDDMASLPSRQIAVLANKQSLLPSISDPGIWRVKCTPGKEMMLVRSLLLKSADHKLKTGVMRIKSAFSTSTKGIVYIEATAEPFAKESVQGLYGFYVSTFARVPIEEMTSLFNVSFKKKPLTVGQWVRISRGPLKGDLAQISELLDGGVKAIIKAIPRPDYTNSFGSKSGSNNNIRPPKKLFDPEEVRVATGAHPERQRFGGDREMHFVFNGDYYKDGFLFKEVNTATYIHSSDVNPRIEELQLFLATRKSNDASEETKTSTKKEKKSVKIADNQVDENDDDFHDSDDDDEPVKLDNSPSDTKAGMNESSSGNILQNIARELQNAAGLDDLSILTDDSKKMVPFVLGDLVQVTQGELKNLVGKVTAVNQVTKIVRIQPKNSSFRNEIDIEAINLVKYITPGSHVKVAGGQYTGQTGRVVAVNTIDDEHIAAILTDASNTEINCNIGFLQISDEVTTGLSSLNGYELYDLVVLNENESAIVIAVGAEKLRVLNHTDVVKEVLPQELHGKRNTQSQRSSAFDAQQNTVKVGDLVKVTQGSHSNQSGTIKHIMKGKLWLHSNSYLKNSGVFVVNARACVVAGKTQRPSSGLGDLSANAAFSLTRPTVSHGRPPPGKGFQGHGPQAGKDSDVGKTVRIIKGGYKGLLGSIVTSTATHYSLELLARMKKIIIEKESVVIVGTKEGSFKGPSTDEYREAPQTPYLGASDTPRHRGIGSQTPSLGSETPSHYGSETPSGSKTPNGYGSDVFKPNYLDSMPTPSITAGLGGRDWDNIGRGSEQSGSISGTGWENTNAYGNQAFLHVPALGSPFSGYDPGSAYTPTSTGFSPSIGGQTPQSITSSKSSNTNQAALWKEWEPGFIVVVNGGEFSGKLAVMDSLPDQTGVATLRLRDSNGSLGAHIRCNVSNLSLAKPPVNGNIKMFTGKKKGTTGVAEGFDGKDVLLQMGMSRDWVRIAQVAWIHQIS